MLILEKRTLPLVRSIGIFGKIPDFVLVEEEFYIREHWIRTALKNKISLSVYEFPEEFLSDLELFTSQTRFYLDQDFGNRRGVGVALARKIKLKLGAATYLVTSYSKSCFSDEIRLGILDDVFGKYPSPFNLNAQSIEKTENNKTFERSNSSSLIEEAFSRK